MKDDDQQKGRFHVAPGAARGDGNGLLSTNEEETLFQQAAKAGELNNAGAIAAHGIKLRTSARDAVGRAVKRASRGVERARRRQRERLDWHERRAQILGGEQTRARLVQVADHVVRSTLMGVLVRVGRNVVIWGLFLGMLLSDPLTVYMSMHEAFNISKSVGPLNVTHADYYKVLIAEAWALVIFLLVVGGVRLAAVALGTLLFRPQLAKHENHFPAAVDSARKHPTWHLAAMAAGGVALLFVVSLLLHSYAAARFLTGSADEAFTGAVARTLVWAITLLPAIILLLEIFLLSPQQAHIAQVSRWAREQQSDEKRDIRVEQKLIERERREVRRAWLLVLRIVDGLDAVAVRADYAAAIAAQSGLADVERLSEEFQRVPDGDTDDRPAPPIDLSGRPPSLFLPGIRRVSAAAAQAIEGFRALQESPDGAPIAELWRKRRDEASRAAKTATYLPADGVATSEEKTIDDASADDLVFPDMLADQSPFPAPIS